MEIFLPVYQKTHYKSEQIFIDEDDYAFIQSKNYKLGISGNYVRCYGEGLDSKGTYLHRILMNTLAESTLTVDHINGNGRDNRRINLRACTMGENARNKNHIRVSKTSEYIGVHRQGSSYRAELWKKGKRYGRKSFKFAVEAALAYDVLAKEHHGEFANLNFPDKESLMAACAELADLRTKLSKANNAPDKYFHNDPPVNGGSYGTPKPESTAKMLQAYAQYLPSVLQATNTQATPTAQATLGAEQATEPGYQQLNASLTQQYAPILAAINSAVQNQQTQAGSQAINTELTGAGGQAAQSAADLLAKTNPAYANTIAASSKGATDLINSYNLKGLSPGEEAAVERSTNQTNSATGNLGLSNPTNVISNAMNFGDAFNAKRAAMNTAIGTGNQTASTASAGFNPLSVATAQPGGTGITQFQQSGTGANGSSGALSFGQGLLGNQFSQNNAAIGAAASRANANSIPAYMSAVPGYSG